MFAAFLMRRSRSPWCRVEGNPRRQPTRQVPLGVEALERREVPATYYPVVFGPGSQEFGLAANGQVYRSDNYGSSWHAVTGSNTKATALVAAEDGHVFMLASNGALNQTVYEYSGSASNWAPVTGSNTYATTLASTGYYSDLYMLGSNGPGTETVYVYNNDYYGSQNWTAVTGDNTSATALVANWSGVYMLASNGPAYQTVYVYNNDFFGSQNWTAVTGDNTGATALVTSGGNLYMLGSNGPAYQTAYQYGGSPFNWSALTGDNTQVFQLVADSDGNLDMVASNGGPASVWRYGGSGTNWTPLTGASLQNALATWCLGRAHPVAATTYSPVSGTLFGANGPSYLDVQQGGEGDCWLMATLAEVADRVPGDITGMFSYDGTTVEDGSQVGVYTVRLYNNSGTAEYVTVDTELPAGGGTYAHPVGGSGAVNGSANPVLWPALLEKAYAEADGVGIVTGRINNSNAYDALGNTADSQNNTGGLVAWAYQAITGNSSSEVNINPGDAVSAWNQGKLVVLCTPSSPTSSYIVGSHCYAMVNYWCNSIFIIYNPWGDDGHGWAPGYSGTIYGRMFEDATFVSQNFRTQAVGAGAAPG
jgi:hypothetical protein